MLRHPEFSLRHVREDELDRFITLMNELEARGPYLPCRLHSPALLRQQFREHGMASEEFERLVLVDARDAILGTLWHFKSVPYFDAREIGYILFDQAQRGRGLVSAAVTLLAEHLFKSRQLNRLELRMDTRNGASEQVARKCGFTKEGVARGANFVHGRHIDMCVYALLRDDPRP